MPPTYFTEEVRRELAERYGEKKLYEGGLSVRTSLDPKLQQEARKALINGLVKYDESRGYRGPVKTVSLGDDWGQAIGAEKRLGDIRPWELAVVLESSDDGRRASACSRRSTSSAACRRSGRPARSARRA